MKPMRPAHNEWRLRRALVVTSFAAIGGMLAGPLPAAAAPRAPAAGSCSETCNQKAAECLDGCETKHKEDKARVECKLGCATERQKCDAECK
jgi:hypothetical protein